jgi:hypothetical protein
VKTNADEKMDDEATDKEKVETEASEKTKKKGPEPRTFLLSNPSRVTPEQEQFVAFDIDQRYVPVNPRSKPAGIVVLVDHTPDEPEEVAKVSDDFSTRENSFFLTCMSLFLFRSSFLVPTPKRTRPSPRSRLSGAQICRLRESSTTNCRAANNHIKWCTQCPGYFHFLSADSKKAAEGCSGRG